MKHRSDLASAKRMVVKVGSALLADAEAGLNLEMVDRLSQEIAFLHQSGVQVALVSSGAVALGSVRLGWTGRSLSVHEKQAAAALGQPMLMKAYDKAFAKHGLQVAQMLLTRDDLSHRRRYLNASNTSETLFSVSAIPIVNENDTVVVREIKFGDNDNLAALVALLINADVLVILTDVDGLFTDNPARVADAKPIHCVTEVNEEVMALAKGSGSAFGTGGMASKLKAARMATRYGVCTIVMSGQHEQMLQRLLQAECLGTMFACGETRQSRRAHWIADVLVSQGWVEVDAGAAKALWEHGASLLPIGLCAVEGHFDKGDCIEIRHQGQLLGRGLCNYQAEEMRQLIGLSSDRIADVLGYSDYASVVHKNNLVLCSSRED